MVPQIAMELIKAERDKGILKETAKKLQPHKEKESTKHFVTLSHDFVFVQTKEEQSLKRWDEDEDKDVLSG